MNKLFQVVVKWHETNRIALYEFREKEWYLNAIKTFKAEKSVIILTTNIATI